MVGYARTHPDSEIARVARPPRAPRRTPSSAAPSASARADRRRFIPTQSPEPKAQSLFYVLCQRTRMAQIHPPPAASSLSAPARPGKQSLYYTNCPACQVPPVISTAASVRCWLAAAWNGKPFQPFPATDPLRPFGVPSALRDGPTRPFFLFGGPSCRTAAINGSHTIAHYCFFPAAPRRLSRRPDGKSPLPANAAVWPAVARFAPVSEIWVWRPGSWPLGFGHGTFDILLPPSVPSAPSVVKNPRLSSAALCALASSRLCVEPPFPIRCCG